MNSMCDMGPDMFCVVEKKLTKTPKRISNLRGYGKITTLNNVENTRVSHDFNLAQPLCGKFGDHLPAKTVMENSQTTLAWDKNVTPAVCSYQNQNLNTVVSLNSQEPITKETKTSTMPTAPYYTTTGEFHNGKC